MVASETPIYVGNTIKLQINTGSPDLDTATKTAIVLKKPDETVVSFERMRQIWGFPYPKKGDVLTVSCISKHGEPHMNKIGAVLLHFEEIPNLIGVSSMMKDGSYNFKELLLPDDIEELLKEPIKEPCLL